MAFLDTYLQILPLIAIIFVGMWAGKMKYLTKMSIFPLIYYIFAPIQVAHNALRSNLIKTPDLIITGAIFLVVSIVLYGIYHLFEKKSSLKLGQSFMAGSTNSGYLGLPLVIALLGTEYEPYAVACMIAYFIYEGILGFGKFGIKEYLKIPTLAALTISVIISSLIDTSALTNQEVYKGLVSYNRSAFILFGMMLLGVSIQRLQVKLSQFTSALWFVVLRLVGWTVGGALLALVFFRIQLISYPAFAVLVIMCLTPISVNSILVGIKKKYNTDFIALSIVLSTIVSIISIPLLYGIIMGLS